jgi:hypothetical protein
MTEPMDPRAIRIIIVLVVLGAVGTTAALLTGGTSAPSFRASPTPSTPLQTCLPVPPPVGASFPEWYPKDLPLPGGTHQAKFNLSGGPTFHQAAFVASVELRAFVKHVLSVWPAKGWTLGVGDAEVGEAEDTFFRPRPRLNGAFRASSVLCDRTKTLVIIAIGVPRAIAPVASPTGTFSSVPLNPGGVPKKSP